MTAIPAVPDKRYDTALLILRLVAGAIFIAHGSQKIFVYGFAGVSTAFASMGVPMASLVAPVVACVELVAGIALVLGLFTRIAALLLACDMLGALFIVHIWKGFFLPKGFEFVLANFAMLVTLALLGAGLYSIDSIFARRGSAVP
jgi:putative oxidoreductase